MLTESQIVSEWMGMIEDLVIPERKMTGVVVQKQLDEKGYLELIQATKGFIRYYGLEQCSKILSLPYAVDFLYHKKDPAYLKAFWFSLIEYMTSKNGLAFPPQKNSDDPREVRYHSFLKSLRVKYKKVLNPQMKREILSWPMGREWVKLKL